MSAISEVQNPQSRTELAKVCVILYAIFASFQDRFNSRTSKPASRSEK